MGFAASRPGWQRAIFLVLFVAVVMAVVDAFREETLILVAVFALLGVDDDRPENR
ncbi:hypothetical protein [Halorussus ruber]|uniref:hypothetical protein n=1 Tax=Halorussus ruber TaxID=1126238 RepID=UPI00143DDA0D|nr:hypothetical protein [Halorussus ruber]